MNNSMHDKLLHAYDTMVKRLHDAVEVAEKLAIPTIDDNLQQAQEKAVELGELTREEASKVAGYLKRDLDDVSIYLEETQQEFSEWLAFESTLIEGQVGDWLNQVADKTTLEWDKISLAAMKAQLYYSGEVVGPGTLECVSCEHTLNFRKTAHIPLCPKCHKTEFKRHSKEG